MILSIGLEFVPLGRMTLPVSVVDLLRLDPYIMLDYHDVGSRLEVENPLRPDKTRD